MATRVIAAQDKTTSGAGDDVQIKAGNANTSGAGGHIIIQPGAQATTGGNGLLIIRQPSGVAGTDEIQLSHDGSKGSIINKDGVLQLGGSHIALRTVANNAKTNLTAGVVYCDGLYSSNVINADGQTNDSYGWAIDSASLNWSQGFHIRVGWSHIKGATNCGIAYTGDNTNGRRATLEVTDGSTGGGAWAYRSSTTTVNTSYNDLNLSGHSAFQRLNATAATTITGIAPASTTGGTPTWIHTDGRIFWLYNVGTFNITLKHDSASSTAGNRLLTETGGDLIIGPGRYAQLVYDGTSSRWRATGENYPYVFPTADGTNGQVLTTNGSGSLSWATVSAGATASGTTNYIAKFTGASTLGNSILYDDGSNVGIGTTSPLGRLDVVGANTYEPIRAITNSASNLESGANATVGLSVNNSNTTAGNGIAISFATATTNSNLYGVGAVGFNSLTHTTLGVPQGNFQVITRDAGGGLTPKLTINTSGNIGFGTTSPDKRLTIAANGPSPGITIYKSPDGTLNSAQLVAALGTGSSNTNAGTTGGNEYGILQLNHSGTVRCQFYANAGGAAGSNFVLDGVSFGTTATSAGQVYIIPANAASKALVVRGAGSQSANLTEWQNDSGTVLASVDNLGRHIKSYNSASGLSTFSVGKTVLGAVHFANPAGTNTSTRNEAAITFRGDVATEAQAGIYVTNDNSTGTHMAFATTDSYATGPQLGLTIANTGAVSFPRASTVSTPAVCSIGSNSNDGGVLKLYSAGFGLRITSLNGDIISGDVNSVNITPGAGGNTTGLNVVANMGANGTVAGFTNNGNVGSKVVVIKGKAAQTGNLTEWQDSTGTVVAAVSPNGAFTGSSFTPYGTINSTTTIFGNNYWTPNLSGVSNPSTGTFTKTTATAAWDSQVYSSEGYTKNVYCAARASQTNGAIMFGLNSDPAANASYSSLDYAWYFEGNSNLYIYENNAQIGSNYGTYTTSTVLSITYDGENVRYWKDGVLQRTVARSTGNPLYFDTSFYTQNASLNSVQFGPIGQPFGISGTAGYHPKFTSQQTLGNSIVYDNGTNVGIGTASPSNNLSIGASAGKIGFQRGSGDGEYCTIGFKSTTGNDRYVFEINNSSGTGELRLNQGGTSTPIGMTFYTNNAEKMRIDSSGNVGIGTASPSFKLQVDAASVDANIVANVTSGYGGIGVYAAGTNKVILGYVGANTNYGSQTVAGDIALKTNNSNLHINTGSGNSVTTAYFSSAGNVGIGNVSPGARLQVDTGATGTKGQIIKAVASQTANLSEWQNNSGTALSYVASNGDIYSTTSFVHYSSGNSGYYLKRPSDNATVASFTWSSGSVEASLYALAFLNLDVATGSGIRMGNWTTWADSVNAQVMWLKNSNIIWGNNALGVTGRTAFNTSAFQITAGSYATIPAPTSRFEVYGDSQFLSQSTSAKTVVVKAAASQTANLTEWQNNSGTALAYMDANGNFAAVTKSFLIPHPTPAKAAEGKKLRYASLEGPENGVYFRGTLTGENEIILPDYWKDLVDPDSITVNLTARKRPQPNLFVVDANAEKVIVESDREICCDFIVYATRKDIAKLEVEPDGN